MTPTGRKALSSKAFGRDYLNREMITLVIQSDNLRGKPLAVRKRDDTKGAGLCFIEPLKSKAPLCLIEREVAPCEFRAQHLLGFS